MFSHLSSSQVAAAATAVEEQFSFFLCFFLCRRRGVARTRMAVDVLTRKENIRGAARSSGVRVGPPTAAGLALAAGVAGAAAEESTVMQ